MPLSIIYNCNMTNVTAPRPFDQALQKASATMDKVYSVEKSTYKGLVAYFKQFSSIEKQHSSKMGKLSKEAGNYMGLKYPLNECLALENPVIKTIISEVMYASSGQSQMHYNFSERLGQIADTFSKLYEQVKSTKEGAMNLINQVYPAMVARAGGLKEQEEKRILNGVHELLDKLHENQVHRVQRIRQNVIISFTLHKKICEKQQEMLSTNNQRLSSIEVEKVGEDIKKHVLELINLHNAYGGQSKLEPRATDRVVQPLKDSLRQSVILQKQKFSMQRIQVSKNTLRQVELQAIDQVSSLMVPLDQKYVNKRGLFSKDMKGHLEYSQRINSVILGRLAYAMIEGYYFNRTHDQAVKAALANMRIRLKAQNKATVVSQTLNTYIQNQYNRRSEETKSLVHSLIYLSRYYDGKVDELSLKAQLEQTRPPVLTGLTQPLNVWVSSVLVNILLDTLINPREGDSYLVPNSTEIFKVVQEFASNYFKIQPQLTLFLFLEKVLRIQQYRQQRQLAPVLEELQSLLTLGDCKESVSEYTMYMYNKLKNDLTTNLIQLYHVQSHNVLAIQCLCWLQLYVRTSDWVLGHIHQCVRVSGYKWLTEQDDNKALLGNAWESNQKLKLLTEVLKENEFQQIEVKVLRSLADKMVSELNLEYQAVIKKLRQKFFTFIIQIVLLNLDTIALNQFSDKDGYCLKLGIELCKIDILCNYKIDIYHNFFCMLSIALTCMETEYKDLLLQTKKTQLWIVEENMFATQNCYDFCSLLAKPIQYMAGVIRELGQEGYSPFKTKFVGTVKLKLHEILRIQLVNYLAFLSHSVRKLQKPEPKVLMQPPKVQKVVQPKQEELNQEYFTFKENCKRLNNIVFIKQNSNEIVKEMLAPETFDRLQDIFNADALKREMGAGRAEQKQLLLRIQQIVKEMNRYQERTIYSIATGTVLTQMKPFMERLYWREPKQSSTFQNFFTGGNTQQPRYSQHTMMANKQYLQDYVMLIKRNVPIEHYSRFCQFFFSMLAQSVKCQMLNPNKFRVPLQTNRIYDYLNIDVANITNTMKKDCTDEELVIKYFYQPLKKALDDFREDPNKAIERYQKAMISKNINQTEESLAILYIRGATDKKLKDFVKRVRPK